MAPAALTEACPGRCLHPACGIKNAAGLAPCGKPTVPAPTEAEARKKIPLGRWMVGYFPDALRELARMSLAVNEQHNPGEPMHWAREKSSDHLDCAARHMLDVGKIDTDGQRHTAKWAWRALALLQLELENVQTSR
jgi:hypothetical protein